MDAMKWHRELDENADGDYVSESYRITWTYRYGHSGKRAWHVEYNGRTFGPAHPTLTQAKAAATAHAASALASIATAIEHRPHKATMD